MRILVTAGPGYGHLHPLVPLARALSDAGHDVAVAIAPELRPRAEAAGFLAFDAGLDFGPAWARLRERHPDQVYNTLEPSEILAWYLPHLFAEILAPAMLADLEPLVLSRRPDLILHDCWELAAPIAAASAGIPSVSHTLGPRFGHELVALAAAAVAPLWRRRGLEPDPAAGLYRHLCLDISPPSLQPGGIPSRRDPVRPLRPMPQPPVAGELLPGWIERRRDVPLLYMTLGTNTNSDHSMFRSVIEALSSEDLDLLVTVGHGQDPAGLRSLAANVHIENYVPQSLLLPRCAAVICHGGAGTTLNALSLGLPLFLLPQGADQYVISDLVVAAGAGRMLVPAEVNPQSVRAGVRALLDEPGCRAAALRLAREIAAMPAPDQAVKLIEATAPARIR